MKHIYTSFAKACLLTLLCLMTTLTAKAVNVTYSLTTQIDGRTMTQTVNQTAGAALNLPKDMKRGFTTYTYYSDAALTEQITTVPSADATVYVNYSFDPPFLFSTDEIKQPYFFKSGGTNSKWGRLTATGYSSLTDHKNYQYYLEGDAYSLYLYSVSQKQYLTWNGKNSRKLVLARPDVGWQLLRNLDSQDLPHDALGFSLGSYSASSNNGEYFIACEQNVDNTLRLIPRSNFSINDNNEIQNGTNSNCPERNARMIIFIPGEAQVAHQVSFIVVQNYEPYGKIRAASAFAYTKTFQPYKISRTADHTKNIYKGLWGDGTSTEGILFNDELYSYKFFKDKELTQEYGDTEFTEGKKSSVAAASSIVIWVEETYKPEHTAEFITDRWITICLPYGVTDLKERFGEAEDGSSAVIVNKFTELNVSGNKYNLVFTEVDKIEANTPYMFKAKSVLNGKYLTLYNTVAPPTDSEDPDADEKYLSIEHADNNAVVTMRGTYDGKTLTASTDDCYSFFMGYTKSNDPTHPKYAEDWADESPKFYKVVNNTREIKPFHCWFDIKDLNPATGAKTLGIVAETETGIREVVNPDGTSYPVADIYNTNGQLVRANATGTEGLPKGLYIMGGRKVVVK